MRSRGGRLIRPDDRIVGLRAGRSRPADADRCGTAPARFDLDSRYHVRQPDRDAKGQRASAAPRQCDAAHDERRASRRQLNAGATGCDRADPTVRHGSRAAARSARAEASTGLHAPGCRDDGRVADAPGESIRRLARCLSDSRADPILNPNGGWAESVAAVDDANATTTGESDASRRLSFPNKRALRAAADSARRLPIADALKLRSKATFGSAVRWQTWLLIAFLTWET